MIDQATLSYFDADNSGHEDRYVEIGFSGGRLFTVVFVELGDEYDSHHLCPHRILIGGKEI